MQENRNSQKFLRQNTFQKHSQLAISDTTIFDVMNFKKLGGPVSLNSLRCGKLSTFSQQDDVVLKTLKRDKLETLYLIHWGTATTNQVGLNFPKVYGVLELDRLILQRSGGILQINVNLALNAVTCAGKLSLVTEYTEEALPTATVEKIKSKGNGIIVRRINRDFT